MPASNDIARYATEDFFTSAMDTIRRRWTVALLEALFHTRVPECSSNLPMPGAHETQKNPLTLALAPAPAPLQPFPLHALPREQGGTESGDGMSLLTAPYVNVRTALVGYRAGADVAIVHHNGDQPCTYPCPLPGLQFRARLFSRGVRIPANGEFPVE